MFCPFPVRYIAIATALLAGAANAYDPPNCDQRYGAVDIIDHCPQLLRHIELAALRGSLDCHGMPYSAPCVRTHLHQIEHAMRVSAKTLENALHRQTSMAALREAQAAWTQYRDLQCEVSGVAASEDRQMQQALADMCRIELTQDRLDQLSRLGVELGAAIPQADRR